MQIKIILPPYNYDKKTLRKSEIHSQYEFKNTFTIFLISILQRKTNSINQNHLNTLNVNQSTKDFKMIVKKVSCKRNRQKY